MSWIAASDPLALLALQTAVGTPAQELAATGTSVLDTPQVAAKLGEAVPVVFGRRRNGSGGVLISPRATEASFANDQTTNAVTAFYHLVLSEGLIDRIERRDVYQGQCRVGFYSQTHNRRAGTWDPGNFIVPVSGFDAPDCPQYCGSVGNYPDISTLSFGITVANGDDSWRRQVHCFIRGGMYVQRLYDNVYGPSDNFCDLLRWGMLRTGKIPSTLIDVTSLTLSASFLERYGLTFNAELKESSNIPDFIAQWARYFLLRETNTNGKKGVRPVLPVTATGELITTAITPVYTFTDDVIMPNSFEANYTPLSDRLPFVAQVMWRQHPDGHDVDTIRTAEVRYLGQALDGPYESHDLSLFCTSELHAVRVGAYIISRRQLSTHTARLVARPQIHSKIINQGDIVRVRVKRETQSSPAAYHDWLYQVERISKTLAGDVSYELSHFPVDNLGRSLITLDVLAVQPTGIILPNNRTGPGCDLFGPDDRTLPSDTGRTGISYGSSGMPRPIPAPPGQPEEPPEDPLDRPPSPLTPFPPGPIGPGTALLMPDEPCGPGQPPPEWRWLKCGEPWPGHNKRYFVIGTAEIESPGQPCPLRGEYRCPGEQWTPTDEFGDFPTLPTGREMQLYWQVDQKWYGFGNNVSGWYPSGQQLVVEETSEPYTDYSGNTSVETDVRLIKPDGTSEVILSSINAKVYVVKSRYRDNNGPWQDLYDYSGLG